MLFALPNLPRWPCQHAFGLGLHLNDAIDNLAVLLAAVCVFGTGTGWPLAPQGARLVVTELRLQALAHVYARYKNGLSGLQSQ
jgi:hypothetical protein